MPFSTFRCCCHCFAIFCSVDCVCYSKYLSERDDADFSKIFTAFGVRERVNYDTFSGLCDRLVNDQGNLRDMTRDALLGQKRRATSRSATKGERVLLVDEVDVFFSRDFYGATYNPCTSISGSDVSQLQEAAWQHRNDSASSLRARLRGMPQFTALVKRCSNASALIGGEIDSMVGDLKTWLQWHGQGRRAGDSGWKAYEVHRGQIGYKEQDLVSTNTYYGYYTMWTYFHEAEQGNIKPEVLAQHHGISLMCGSFSYAELPKRFKVILGVTGTLKPETRGGVKGPEPLGTFERKIIKDDYKIKHSTELPSVYGDSRLTFREREHVYVDTEQPEYFRKIEEEVLQAQDGRAVLVFFDTEAAMELWLKSEYGRRASARVGMEDGIHTLQTVKASTPNISHCVGVATRKRTVTLLSREHGRGLDFTCVCKVVEETGGLHIVQTFLSEELSEEIQIRGRTARQTNKGTFKLILLAHHLQKFDITAEEIALKQEGGDESMYDFLHKKRATWLWLESKDRSGKVEKARAAHDATDRFQAALRRGDMAAILAFLKERN